MGAKYNLLQLLNIKTDINFDVLDTRELDFFGVRLRIEINVHLTDKDISNSSCTKE